jgi:hypothetical protein
MYDLQYAKVQLYILFDKNHDYKSKMKQAKKSNADAIILHNDGRTESLKND